METCCEKPKQSRGIISGIIYGLVPHSVCIAFIVFSVLGTTVMSGVLKQIMIIPYFFNILLGISFLMATASAVIYLKKNECLCASGLKTKWKYLTLLYGITIFTNLFVFYGVLPTIANANSNNIDFASYQNLSSLSIKVNIPCTGHASLIMDELKKDQGIKNIIFKTPNIFQIKYDPKITSLEKINNQEIFKTYKIVN